MNPGCTDLSSYNKSLPLPLKSSNTIVIATNDIDDKNIFMNGIIQNIIILYDLFESMGCKSYLFQHTRNNTKKNEFIYRYDIITTDELIKNPMPISTFIEVGTSVSSTIRSYLRSIGAKIVKLYLGNIINIDIETIHNYDVFFNHHIVGEIDEIWTSPQYKQNIDYAAALNRVPLTNTKIVPYVWDPNVITQYGLYEWIPSESDIVIMDPNISFQKCFFYPLLLVEAFHKKHPEWNGKIHIINGDKINIVPNAHNFIIPSLTIKDRIVFHSRKSINDILKSHRSACFITHQWNNDFNYNTLELMYCNYPVLHNSEGWKFGYNYDIHKWDDAIKMLYDALYNHKKNLNVYKSHAANLLWKHSIYNPEVQAEWHSILA